MSYLEIKNIHKHYSDFNITADIKINKGEFFTLLGPSGCGKTTLLRIIAGFIKPDKGNIVIAGKDITKLLPGERNISIVFQNYALFPDRTVYKNISYGPESKRWNKKNIEKKTFNLLSIINMADKAARKPETLSGGEKQRVALVRAIAVEPDILLLDEPLSALDITLRKSLRDEIREIHDKTGLTTIYVTHDQEEALYLSDRICVMDNGTPKQIDTSFNLYHNPESFFTARFIGESNIISVKNIQGDTIITGAGIFEKPDKIINSNLEKPFVFFRPEFCNIVDKEFDNKNLVNLITVKVLKKVFLGNCYRIDAVCENGEKIFLYDYYPYKTTEKKYLEIRIEHIILFK